jgi:serine/threonine-protein kinase RsbT
MTRVVSSRAMKIASEDDVVLVRRAARELAHARGFDAFATAAITTAASELARNVWTHARGGQAVIEELRDGERAGVRMRFEDQGPGIADLERALAGGNSTVRSLGLGLAGSRRLVDQFDIATTVGSGTVVTVTKWARFEAPGSRPASRPRRSTTRPRSRWCARRYGGWGAGWGWRRSASRPWSAPPASWGTTSSPTGSAGG